jgi:hypothetical protein
MRLQFCFPLRSLACMISIAALCATAFADGSHDRTQFGHDIVVNADEDASDVTCFGCSVRVRGHVDTDVTTFGGSVVVENGGEIHGDTTTFGGNVRLDHGSAVNAITVFGGRIHRDSAAAVNGDVTTFSSSIWLFLIFGLPFVILGAFIALIVWVVRRLLRPAVPVTA